MILTCVECGETFEQTNSYKKRFCSAKCRKENKGRLTRWNKVIKDRDKAKTSNIKSISKVQELARASGMSYGEYVAREYARTIKVERKWK